MNANVAYAVLAGMFALVYAISFMRSGSCWRCGGRGAHRDDCPLKH